MDLLKIADKRNKKVKELEDFTAAIKKKRRKMNEKESKSFEAIKDEVELLNKQIEDIQEDDTNLRNDINKKNNNKKMEKFSLLRTIRDIVEGRTLSEDTNAYINDGKKAFMESGLAVRGQIVLPNEARADSVSVGATFGKEVVGEDKHSLMGALYAKSVLAQAGATIYPNLVGDVSIPVYAGTSSAWALETGTTANGAGAFSEVTMSPKRLTTYIDISKQFLAQDGINAEAVLMADIVTSILTKVENTALDGTAGSTSRPAGLFYGASYAGTLSGATSWAKLVGMKAAVETSNALIGNLSYVTTPALAAVFETTSTDSGSGLFCMREGKVGGYPVHVTSNVLAGKVAFANWNDYVMGSWGGMDITVDPFTQATVGKVRIIVNTFWDFKSKRSVSFNLNQMS